MLNLVITLLIIALIAAVLGFGGIATAAVGIAKIVFFVALLLFLIAAVAPARCGARARCRFGNVRHPVRVDLVTSGNLPVR